MESNSNPMLEYAAAALWVLAIMTLPCVAEHGIAETGVAATNVAVTLPPAIESDSNSQPQQVPFTSTSAAASAEDAAAEAALLQYVNRSRQEAGSPPLRMDDTLRQAARLHAGLMVANRRLEHQFQGEPSLLQRIALVSLLPLDHAGENIANAGCPESANDVLMRSPHHRANLLDPSFNVVGVAAVWSHDRLYVVQDFGHVTASHSARDTADLVGDALIEARKSEGLSTLSPFSPPHLDDAACAMAQQDHPNAHLVAASYTNRKVITYTQSRPEVLPPSALDLLENPNLRHFAVGSCYARNNAYPTGTYWVAILLY
ncbi:MAG: CAP domain-containing protein [Terriglobales bacterium]